MHSNPFPCPECRGTADIMGDHQVGCGGNGDRISRHHAIRNGGDVATDLHKHSISIYVVVGVAEI